MKTITLHVRGGSPFEVDPSRIVRYGPSIVNRTVKSELPASRFYSGSTDIIDFWRAGDDAAPNVTYLYTEVRLGYAPPHNPNAVFAEEQVGELLRVDERIAEIRELLTAAKCVEAICSIETES